MKKTLSLLTWGTLSLLACSCASNQMEVTPGTPVFSNFTYTGQDAVYEQNPLASDEFYTPILQGCYPRPQYLQERKRLLPGMFFVCHQSGRTYFPFDRSGQLETNRPCARPPLATEGGRHRNQCRRICTYHPAIIRTTTHSI